jgi:hypothetical protein
MNHTSLGSLKSNNKNRARRSGAVGPKALAHKKLRKPERCRNVPVVACSIGAAEHWVCCNWPDKDIGMTESGGAGCWAYWENWYRVRRPVVAEERGHSRWHKATEVNRAKGTTLY